jgi:hypothetical protein
MAEWPEVLDQIHSGGPVKDRQAALSRGYRTYISLRRLQDMLELGRRNFALTAEDLRLQFHVSEAVLEVRARLIAAQSEFGRSYSFKNEKWLLDTRNRTRRALDSRRISIGDPPWGTPVASPKASRNAAESASSHTDPSEGPRSTHRSKARVDDGPDLTSRGANTARAGGRPKWVGPVAVGTIAAICIAIISIAPEESMEVLSSVLVVAMLAGLTWILATSADARRLLGLLLIGMAKISWIMLRGLVALLAGMFGLVFRR